MESSGLYNGMMEWNGHTEKNDHPRTTRQQRMHIDNTILLPV